MKVTEDYVEYPWACCTDNKCGATSLIASAAALISLSAMMWVKSIHYMNDFWFLCLYHSRTLIIKTYSILKTWKFTKLSSKDSLFSILYLLYIFKLASCLKLHSTYYLLRNASNYCLFENYSSINVRQWCQRLSCIYWLWSTGWDFSWRWWWCWCRWSCLNWDDGDMMSEEKQSKMFSCSLTCT